MRIRYWWLGVGTVCAGLALGAFAERGWGQLGELPGLRATTLPPLPEQAPVNPPEKLPILPTTPEVVYPAAPMDLKLPPPRLPSSEDLVPSRVRAPESPAYLPPTQAPGALMPAVTGAKVANRQEPAVIVEWLGPATATLHRPMVCNILVRNTGAATVHNVTVRQRLNPGVTCNRTEPPATTERDDLIWTIGTLQAGQQRRLELVLVASQRGPLDCQAAVTFSSVAGHQIQIREPLLLVKMRMPETAIIGDNVNILFAVANPGDGVAELVKVKAILPEGFDSPRGSIIEVEIGNLAPKESRTLQIPCVAKTSGSHKLILVATADGSLTARDQAVTEILVAKLDLAVTGPKLRYLDRHAVYTLKVSNPGSAPASNVTLHEVVPAGFKFHTASANGRWDETNKTVSWQLGDLLPGQSREVAIDLVAAATGDHRLQAIVASSRGAKTEASAITRIEGSSSLVIELVDVDDPIEVGGETAYEIRIANAGTKMETNVELSCTLPDQVELRGAKSIAGMRHRIEGREVIFDALPRLAPKADVIYRVTVRGLQPGDARFRARVRADGMPEPVLREESTRFYNDNVLPK